MDELKSKYVGRFFGEEKIADIGISENKTPLGSVIFTITTVSGKTVDVTEKTLALSISDEKVDATALYTARLNAISEDCIKVIAEYDIPSYLFDRVSDRIELELKNHLERAASIAWFGTPDEYAPGFTTSGTVTFLMAEKLNQKFPPKNAAG